jgi:hypothetical protein
LVRGDPARRDPPGKVTARAQTGEGTRQTRRDVASEVLRAARGCRANNDDEASVRGIQPGRSQGKVATFANWGGASGLDMMWPLRGDSTGKGLKGGVTRRA